MSSQGKAFPCKGKGVMFSLVPQLDAWGCNDKNNSILLQKYNIKAEIKQNSKFQKKVKVREQRYPVDKSDNYIMTTNVFEYIFHPIRTFFLNLFKDKKTLFLIF